MPDLTIVLLLLIIPLMFFSAVVLDYMILNSLRKSAPTVYEKIGKPTLWVHMGAKFGYHFGFLLLGQFRKYDLPRRTHKLCMFNQIVIIAIYSLIAVMIHMQPNYR